jgi:hypothetical protein
MCIRIRIRIRICIRAHPAVGFVAAAGNKCWCFTKAIIVIIAVTIVNNFTATARLRLQIGWPSRREPQ